MASRNKYRKMWLRWRRGYERRAYKEFRKVFAQYAKAIDLKGATIQNLDSYLKETADIKLLEEAYAKVYLGIGIVHRERVLKGAKLHEQKGYSIKAGQTLFEKSMLRWLMRYAGDKIVSVHRSFLETIKKAIVEMVSDEWVLDDISDKLIDTLIKEGAYPWQKKSFYKYQTERIARTETTAAANRAALEAADDTGFVMVKEWISVGRGLDGRTREHEKGDDYDHVDMDGVQVPRFGKFETPSSKGTKELLDFPGDPRGSAANVINCRCTVALIAARDRAGNLIPTF